MSDEGGSRGTVKAIFIGLVVLLAFAFVVWVLIRVARNQTADYRLLALAVATVAGLVIGLLAAAPWRRKG